MNKRILRAKEAEISKAGRMVFDALFGDSDEFQKKLEREIEDEEAGDAEAITVPGHSFIRCATCGREQVVEPDVDVRRLAQHGWRLEAGGQWRCAFCVAP